MVLIFDNLIFVQVKLLLLRCRGHSVSPAVATDHQSAKRGEKAVTRNRTGQSRQAKLNKDRHTNRRQNRR
jgi:hypothetical protein